MAKSGKHTRKTSHKSAAKAEVQAQKARSASVSAPKDWLERPDPNAETKPIEKKIFWGIALFGLLVLLFLSLGSGINADDKFQVDYSQKLLDYYGSFGKDTSALNISAETCTCMVASLKLSQVQSINYSDLHRMNLPITRLDMHPARRWAGLPCFVLPFLQA
ncbi:MAG: hypothetical protein R2778_18245 [Saprospiraceae bacterium]